MQGTPARADPKPAEGGGVLIRASYVIETCPGAASRVAMRMLGGPNVELRGGDGCTWIECVVHASSILAVEAVVTLLVQQHHEIRGVWPEPDGV